MLSLIKILIKAPLDILEGFHHLNSHLIIDLIHY